MRIKNDKVLIGLTKEFREKYNIKQAYIEFVLPKNLKSVTKFNEVRIIPLYNGKEFTIEFIYDSSQLELPTQVNGDGYMSIDIGVDNLMACSIFSNGQFHQFLIDGKRIKSINAYYNKTIASLKSQYSTNKTIEHPNLTKRMRRLYNGRKNRINAYFNETVKVVIEKCIEYGVGTIVVGHNDGSKQEIKIGKENNQNFVCIPYRNLTSKLVSKCILHGINYVEQEESYTSKACSMNMDEIPVYGKEEGKPKFSGYRKYRGLYKSRDGKFLNADINGSINILIKYFRERKLKVPFGTDNIRALVNVPCQKVYTFCSSSIL